MRTGKNFLFIAASLLMAPDAFALSLGAIDVHSSLSQPLAAEIPLPAARAAELAKLHVSLASADVFRDRGVEPPPDMSMFRFSLAYKKDGSPYLKVRSKQPIYEPLLSFFVELSWDSGHLIRGYDILLDPPGHSQRSTSANTEQSTTPALASSQPQTAEIEAAPEETTLFVDTLYDGKAYGPTTRYDTLSEIAYRVRPDPEMSLPQVMMALFEQNPEAFMDNNINRLKAGYMLELKDPNAITALPKNAAAKAVQAHGQRDQGDEWQAERTMALPETERSGKVMRVAEPPAEVSMDTKESQHQPTELTRDATAGEQQPPQLPADAPRVAEQRVEKQYLEEQRAAEMNARAEELERLQSELVTTQAVGEQLQQENAYIKDRIRIMEEATQMMLGDVGKQERPLP